MVIIAGQMKLLDNTGAPTRKLESEEQHQLVVDFTPTFIIQNDVIKLAEYVDKPSDYVTEMTALNTTKT